MAVFVLRTFFLFLFSFFRCVRVVVGVSAGVGVDVGGGFCVLPWLKARDTGTCQAGIARWWGQWLASTGNSSTLRFPRRLILIPIVCCLGLKAHSSGIFRLHRSARWLRED